MRKKKHDSKQQSEEKVLDVHAGMQGTLRFDDPVNLRINGKFEGTLDTKGMLMVGQKADIKANITGESVSIAGNVIGNIKALKSLKLEATAKLDGDIDTPLLSIQEGAILNGNLSMGRTSSQSSSSRGDWMNINQLAKYLEVDVNKVNEWANSGMLPAAKEGSDWVFDKSKVDQWISEGKVKV
ncbi:MAG: helix-turn-helix domain-containing protein [Candidatus Omnitrophica bacterium]|nr:helix-turn-helix domain-containing protein [Candidatus Omnitrophota bacterium]